MRRILSLAFLAASTLLAQSNPQKLRVVLPSTPGSIAVTLTDGWKIESFSLYIDGLHGTSTIYRPVLQTYNEETKLRASYSLFANDTKAPTAEGCRESHRVAMDASRKFAKQDDNPGAEIKASTYTTPAGRSVPVTSYIRNDKQFGLTNQFNMRAFIGDTNNCATLLMSKDQYQPSDDKPFGALIDRFIEGYEKDYAPNASDYTTLANLLTERKQPRLAAIYAARAVAK